MHKRSIERDGPRIRAAFATEDWPLLTRLCRQALRKSNSDLNAHRLLGFSLNKQRKLSESLKAYKQAIVFWPTDAELLINYGNVLIEHARNGDALPILEKVCKLLPNRAICWLKLAECCYLLGLHNQGFDASQTAAALAETAYDHATALKQSAIHRRELGQVQEAVGDCEAAIVLCPNDSGNYTNKLLFMLADPRTSARELTAAARDFGSIFETPLIKHWPSFENYIKSPWRKLKVGFLSPDFRTHAVMYFVEGLLAQLDRRQFEVYAFYLYPQDDSATVRVQCHADHFVPLSGSTPEEQANSIQAIGIDILIDLAGHTGNNGLLAMARKPAPVQVSTIGYPGTTGLQAIDWWISDDVTDPPEADVLYVERLYRLPTRWACYRPMSRNPLWRYQPAYQVRATPALTNGFVTFGSCNNLGKLTDEVLALWGRLLVAIPESRLLIEGKNLGNETAADCYRERCANLGIDPERLVLVNLDGSNQYLTYHRIDIALDPFPLCGGTSSNDLLWMGVPLITMDGDSLKSRMGVGLLAYIGRHDWVARTPDEYLRIAKRLAADVTALNKVRMGLRDEVEKSVLMREDVFATEFGHALRRMWMYWLAESEYPDWSSRQVDEQVNEWFMSRPEPTQGELKYYVGVAPGERIPLTCAYDRLQTLLEKAKNDAQQSNNCNSNLLSSPNWKAATEFAERILCAKSHDPVALTVLAEIENAHGHLDFGRIYLKQAMKALAELEPAGELLARTQHYVKDMLDYLASQSPC